MSEENIKLCFQVTFNIIIKLHFRRKFNLHLSSFSEDTNYEFFEFCFFNVLNFILPLLAATKLMTSASITQYQHFFDLKFFL